MMACSEGILWKESLQLLREMSTMQCLICKGSRPENRQAMIQDGSVQSASREASHHGSSFFFLGGGRDSRWIPKH